MSEVRWKWSSAARQTKELSIPDKVPVEAVIGRGGSYCRSLRETHGVSCIVDADVRKMTLKGDQTNLRGAEDELSELFARFEIANPLAESLIGNMTRTDSSRQSRYDPSRQSRYDPSRQSSSNSTRQSRSKPRCVHVIDPSAQWLFEIGKSSDDNVKDHRYRLKQIDQRESTASAAGSENDFAPLNPWITEFDERKTGNFAKKTPETSCEVSIAFGTLCFKPLSTRFPKATISWTELQELKLCKDFQVWWTNVCVRTSLTTVALLKQLEVEMEKGVPQFSTILVTLADKRKVYELDYHLVDGKWKLQSGHARRVVRSTFDVVVDNGTSLRVRGFTCGTISNDVLGNLEQHVNFSTPATNNLFDTKVALRRSAPYGLELRWAVPKLKFHLEFKGVHFTVSWTRIVRSSVSSVVCQQWMKSRAMSVKNC